MNGELIQLFPTPVGLLEFRPPTAAENQILNEQTKDWQANSGNKINVNHYILNTPGLETFKSDLTALINEYFDMVYMPASPIELYITTSWVNLTQQGEFHHMHNHSNSLLSGTYYIDVNEDDVIQFSRYHETGLLFTFLSRQNTAFNSIVENVKVKNHHIILFQSNLVHGVPPKETPGPRISLSFNIFVKGTLGNQWDLTQLTI